MVKRFSSKNVLGLAIALCVIANLSLGNYVFAKQLQIKAGDVEKIKTALGMAQTIATAADVIINNKDLATVLNTLLKGGAVGTDITYGLVVLSALNEMDLIDMVISQRYKTEAREYFKQILNERTDLTTYWKRIGYDLPKIASGYITGPIAALTLNTFAITDKTIAIFVEINVLQKIKLYDGLWYYFDMRKQGNEPHQIAWEETKIVMGFAINSLSGLYRNNGRDKKITNLEQQFFALYEKWKPYVTPFGISETYKKQVKAELSATLIAAAKENAAALVKKESTPSLIDKLVRQLAELKAVTAALIAKINPFKAGIVINLSDELKEELIGVGLQSIEPAENSSPRAQEFSENGSRTTIEAAATTTESAPTTEPAPKIENVTTTEPATTTESATTTEPAPVPEPEPIPAPAPPAPAPGPAFCEKSGDNPRRYRVLINEIAWMGTTESPNDEWIELKNVWGIPVKLAGWQILDKSRQIKIIFNENDIIPADGYYLLERTDDNSMPDAEADLIYTGALSNNDEALYLFDADCVLEDEVLASPNWPAGDNSLKKPMARFDVSSWYDGVSTAGKDNGAPPAVFFSPAGASASPTPSPPISPKIIITETYIGDAANEKNDFVELYNPNSESVGLTDWYLQRKTAGAEDFSSYVPHGLLAGKTINALDYFLIANASSTFATSADAVTTYPLTENNALVLKNSKQEIIDEVSTGGPPDAKSYGRRWSSSTLNYANDVEAQTPTPRAQNQNSANENNDGGESAAMVINEIAWTGTKANPFDEWLEIFVNSTTTLDGWKILGSENGTTTVEINLAGFASSSSYILIERTDDNAISDTPADFFFTGGLNNSGMKLELYNSDNVLVDSVDCSSGWFAGSASPNYVSMERINPLAGSFLANWASNNLITKNGLDIDANSIKGTPKAENSVAKSYTEIIGGLSITENTTLTKLGNPYLVEGSITVAAGTKLTIESGVTIKFKHHSAWHSELKVEGELEAIGGDSEDQKIVFTSFYDATGTVPAAGDWEWLYLKNAEANLKNVVVKYAGKEEGSPPETPPFTRGAIQIDGGQINIEKLLVEESETLGVWIKDSTSTLIAASEFRGIDTSWSKPAAIYIENGSSTISNSVFENNNIGILVENYASSTIENNAFTGNQTPVQITAPLPIISNNTFTNNNYNGVYLTALVFPDGQTSMTWPKTNVPYIINNLTLNSGLALQVEAGTIIKFLNNGRLTVNGDFEANGTSSDKIVFTSIQDDEYGGDTNNDGASTQPLPGRWHYIYFSSSSASPVLENVIVRYGGWYNVFTGGLNAKSGAVKTEENSLTISNSLFENNFFAGLELTNATTTIENTAFNKNEYGIYIENDAGECPDLSDAIFGEDDNANATDVYPPDCAP